MTVMAFDFISQSVCDRADELLRRKGPLALFEASALPECLLENTCV
jgi:hypothetical protein